MMCDAMTSSDRKRSVTNPGHAEDDEDDREGYNSVPFPDDEKVVHACEC